MHEYDDAAHQGTMNTVILIVILTMSLIGNSLVIIVSATLSAYSTFAIYILSMAILSVLECTLTMSLATGFSVQQAWTFGDFVKGFNCCFTQMQNIGALLTITVMAADRYLVLCRLHGRRQVTMKYAKLAVFYAWMHALAVSVPVLFPQACGIKVEPFVERSLCGLSKGTASVYTSALLTSSVGIPCAVTLFCLVSIFLGAYKWKFDWKGSNFNCCDHICQTQSLRAYYVLTLFLTFLIMKFPYLIVDISSKFSEVSGRKVVNWPHYQTVLVWMMFGFSAVYPMITFAWFKEMKEKLPRYLFCPRRKKVCTGDVVPTAAFANNAGDVSHDKILSAGQKSHPLRQHSTHVPVLYATMNGLHLLEPRRQIGLAEPTSKDFLNANVHSTSYNPKARNHSVPVHNSTPLDKSEMDLEQGYFYKIPSVIDKLSQSCKCLHTT